MRIILAIMCIVALAFINTHSSGSGATSTQNNPAPLKSGQDVLAPYRSISFGTTSVSDLEQQFPALEAVLLQHPSSERGYILSITLAYSTLIDDLAYKKNSAAFLIHGTWIYYDEGRMTSKAYIADTQYRSIFYPYSLKPLTQAFTPAETLAYTRPIDFYQALLNVSCCTRETQRAAAISTEVAHATREHRFLNNTLRMHPLAGKALEAVDAELDELRKHDARVHAFLSKIQNAFGYANKTVLRSQSANISMHALGLAVDIIPRSYEGKEVYWVWTRNNYPKRWKDIPLEKRWAVPHAVVRVFQKHGFIWGGKWNNFDTIHFEYRPELIVHARMQSR